MDFRIIMNRDRVNIIEIRQAWLLNQLKLMSDPMTQVREWGGAFINPAINDTIQFAHQQHRIMVFCYFQLGNSTEPTTTTISPTAVSNLNKRSIVIKWLKYFSRGR